MTTSVLMAATWRQIVSPAARGMRIGLDVGRRSVTLVACDRHGHVVKTAVRDLPEDADASLLGAAVAEIARETKLLGAAVNVCVPRQEVIEKHLVLPTAPEAELAQLVRFQAERVIPFPIDQVSLAHAVLGEAKAAANGTNGNGNGAGNAKALEVIVTAVRKRVLRDLVGVVERAGLRVNAVEVAPFPAARTAIFADAKAREQTIALADIGAETTEIALLRNGRLIASRSASVGWATGPAGGDSSADGTETKKSARPETGESRRKRATTGESGRAGKKKEARWAIRLAGELSRSLHSWAKDEGDRAERILLCGPGALRDEIHEAVARRVEVPATVFDPLAGSAVANGTPGALFPTALGLATAEDAPGVPRLDLAAIAPARAARAERRRRRVLSVLAGVCVVLAALAGWNDLRTREAKVAALKAELDELKPWVDDYRAVSKDIAEIRRWEGRRRLALDTIRDLSAALPPHRAFVKSFSIATTGRVRVVGQAKDEAIVRQILKTLGESELFEQTAFESFARRENQIGGEFVITATLKGEAEPSQRGRRGARR